jgi:hypothetical protein
VAKSGSISKTPVPARSHPGGSTTIKEREELLRFFRRQERASALAAEEPSAVLRADFEQQLASVSTYDQDEGWAAATEAAREEIAKAQEVIAQRCTELGIPKRFAPTVSMSWHGRGENAISERRAELRRVAVSRIAAIEKKTIATVARKIIELEATVVMSGLTSDAAKGMLEQITDIETLMPKLDAGELAKMLENRKREPSYRRNDYSAPRLEGCAASSWSRIAPRDPRNYGAEENPGYRRLRKP